MRVFIFNHLGLVSDALAVRGRHLDEIAVIGERYLPFLEQDIERSVHEGYGETKILDGIVKGWALLLRERLVYFAERPRQIAGHGV